MTDVVGLVRPVMGIESLPLYSGQFCCFKGEQLISGWASKTGLFSKHRVSTNLLGKQKVEVYRSLPQLFQWPQVNSATKTNPHWRIKPRAHYPSSIFPQKCSSRFSLTSPPRI